MAEDYFGPKFSTVFLSKIVPLEPKIRKLIFWGKKFSLLGLTPSYEFGAAGNLSFRTEKGFIITAAGKELGKLKEEDFVEVLRCDIQNREVSAIGKFEPSSETMLHHSIYKERGNVDVIFHVHDEYAIENCEELGLRCTENEKPAATIELVEEVLKAMENLDYIVIKNHGIISLGRTFEETGERIIDVNNKIKIE
ncbi:MAG: class II aldolase/adducin family protein [Nanoarchaeota archaeon]|nr:class II aldolase/adducin family protein [Nanoarchaeota archaeon]